MPGLLGGGAGVWPCCAPGLPGSLSAVSTCVLSRDVQFPQLHPQRGHSRSPRLTWVPGGGLRAKAGLEASLVLANRTKNSWLIKGQGLKMPLLGAGTSGRVGLPSPEPQTPAPPSTGSWAPHGEGGVLGPHPQGSPLGGTGGDSWRSPAAPLTFTSQLGVHQVPEGPPGSRVPASPQRHLLPPFSVPLPS